MTFKEYYKLQYNEYKRLKKLKVKTHLTELFNYKGKIYATK